MVFVCFFDKDQRPSRNCIRALCENADQYEEKGVTVIAIHASMADRNVLNQWAQESNIPFPIEMIKGNEQTHFKWSIASLPWLILTDKQHIVIADGLSVIQVAEKSKTAK